MTLAGILAGLALTSMGVQAAFSKPAVAAPTITQKPAAFSSSASATFAFSGPTGANFKCSRDGATYAGCTSPTTYSGLADGSHTFQVKAVIGLDESSAASYSWTIDRQSPAAPTLTSKPGNPSNVASPTFAFTDADNSATFQCSLDGEALAACSSPKGFSSLSQTSHTLRLQAVDPAGNTSDLTTYTWVIDTTAPAAPAWSSKPSNPTPNATNSFAWTDSESGLASQCSLENGAWFGCSSSYTWKINDGNYGQHQIAVRSVDAAGNVSLPATYTFKYEKGLPSSGVPFTISGSTNGITLGNWTPVNVRVTNPNPVTIFVSSLTVKVDTTKDPAGCSSTTNLEISQSNVSSATTLAVPANSSVELPAGAVTAPRIRIVDLPTVNQDACKGKTFALTYSGTATN